MEAQQPNVGGLEHNKENWPPDAQMNHNTSPAMHPPLHAPPDHSFDKQNLPGVSLNPRAGQAFRPQLGPAQVQKAHGQAQFHVGPEVYTGPPSADQQLYQNQNPYQVQAQQYPPHHPPVQSYQGMNQYPADPFQRPMMYQTANQSMHLPSVPSIDPRLLINEQANIVISAAEFEDMRCTMNELRDFKNAQVNFHGTNDETHTALAQAIDEAQQLRAALNARVAHEDGKADRKPRNNALVAAAHSVMIDLLDVVMVKNENGEMVEDRKKLPSPLSDGVPSSVAADGTRRYNPRWSCGITKHRENMAYRDACVALIRSREEAKGDSEIDPSVLRDHKALTKAVDKYFGTLRNRYKQEYDEEARKKAEETAQKNKIRGRKKQMAKIAREGAQLFRKAYGLDKTEGVDELIQTDWMPSEHSDCGNMSPDSFERHRFNKIGGNAGWEERDLLWRSSKLVKLYCRVVELYHDEQADIARRTGKRQKTVKQTPTFECLPVNANNDTPKIRENTGAMPYEWCVSKHWAKTLPPDKQGLELEENPDWPIFELAILDDNLSAKSRAYLAKYKD
ncbi:hypothetical protein GALMADRAFT_144016 [Galerina marginata CBS 339.88]|uniref:Uncharacterized protein n=1 Tax=Galerina marginata (strain CBS 339.88) TaxID=685588 RepID=A0A067SMR6_GALM3|nr:hypothetical protein GALMADRAFT_144016 [Galerina marginata CBS 339.88]